MLPSDHNFPKRRFPGVPKDHGFQYQNGLMTWLIGGTLWLRTPPNDLRWSTEAMRCLASMETVGQCYASTIAGELASQDPESRAAACDLVVMSWTSPYRWVFGFSVRNFGGLHGLIQPWLLESWGKTLGKLGDYGAAFAEDIEPRPSRCHGLGVFGSRSAACLPLKQWTLPL